MEIKIEYAAYQDGVRVSDAVADGHERAVLKVWCEGHDAEIVAVVVLPVLVVSAARESTGIKEE